MTAAQIRQVCETTLEALRAARARQDRAEDDRLTELYSLGLEAWQAARKAEAKARRVARKAR